MGLFFFFFDISVGFTKGQHAVCFLYYLKYGQVKKKIGLLFEIAGKLTLHKCHTGAWGRARNV